MGWTRQNTGNCDLTILIASLFSLCRLRNTTQVRSGTADKSKWPVFLQNASGNLTAPPPPTPLLFITVSQVISWHIKIDLKQIYCSFSGTQKIQNDFFKFCYYLWGQHCWWTETNIFGNDFFVFDKFPLTSTVLLLSLPYRCSGVPGYACCVDRLRQNVGLQTWIWRHKQRISSNNDHHTPLLNTRIW